MPIDPIAARIHAFKIELEALVGAAAIQAVAAALGGRSATPAPQRRPAQPSSARRSRPAPKRAPAPPQPRKVASPTPVAPSQLVAATVAYVRANPGVRCEQIGSALGVSAPAMKEQVSALVDEKKLRKTGKTRGTKYFVV